MTLALTWLSIGSCMAYVMLVGFRVQVARGDLPFVTTRHWMHICLAVPFWPVQLAGVLCVACGKPGWSGVIEYVCFWPFEKALQAWQLRQIMRDPRIVRRPE
jgi:hypothetical protein